MTQLLWNWGCINVLYEGFLFMSIKTFFIFQQPGAEVPADGENNGLMLRVDEGVDEFFTKKVTSK